MAATGTDTSTLAATQTALGPDSGSSDPRSSVSASAAELTRAPASAAAAVAAQASEPGPASIAPDPAADAVQSAHDTLALARLLQLVSPALPIGSFAYSEALEYATEAGWVTTEAEALAWVIGRLDDGVGRLDGPILARLWPAFRDQRAARSDVANGARGNAGDGRIRGEASDSAQGAGNGHIHGDASDAGQSAEQRIRHWSRTLWALRETAELRAADRDLGRSLARLLVALGVPAAAPWVRCEHTTHATVFALAAAHHDIALAPTITGYLYAWCESQVAAAVKLVPLGQSAGQRILAAASERLPALVARAQTIADDDIGAGAPGLAIASSLHETMYVRLFRS